ncbi:aminotransferase class I/II-fold pyridoxal phosphate-dependent enzyme [Photobacterium phosphoreum]|jgi:aromatic-amino-acid transaminase|uniref:Aminotransferase n=2 Tax=Photobacterium phosphoreum TaxID=659 RepID=A0AAW4ZQU7_PHOPO|nr:amino acid aminotransferase [Photobacterium phosphoreum]MCD9473643.1 aminotransferase class I/II-fold pyridoxal phosphate-dependent enzyme [Photobacterium phosphoreum]MCD9478606.1 aminotransferase class I/II-fold pyridoxal phosphate-dependent enzyme [Photobacterium phosphoreum]MCD9483612.1 aminotransferase class I/II-fold pyridoxal phosphate-dependent enzyme [Photobacterium phosphoreum]MCD9489686.1 aminotransferase class I/II-fold pyridoxal phosphate-dependent enzyme [Photobacterium phosphor
MKNMFEKITAAPADPILGLTDDFKADPRTHKINLGVGIYKNEAGNTPILATVKKAEAILLAQETTKSYLGIPGTPEYGLAVQQLLFGADSTLIAEKRIQTAQAPGGTGALRVAAEFIKRQLGDVTVWISNPTWANHHGVFGAAGLDTKTYGYYNAQTKDIDFDATIVDLNQAKSGDVVLLHGCCHNPTGIDPTNTQWQTLAKLCLDKGLLPMFDFAYQGFARGVEEDAQGLRIFADQVPELLVASSFSKNFGLYNERVGAFTLVAKNAEQAIISFSQVKSIARVIYSNPPAHGAAIVTQILNDAVLRAEWEQEVADMRDRIQEMRVLFVATLKQCGVDADFSFIERQNGMFSFSGLNKDQVNRLKNEFAIYIVGSGRISVAGMTKSNMLPLCKGIAAVL